MDSLDCNENPKLVAYTYTSINWTTVWRNGQFSWDIYVYLQFRQM